MALYSKASASAADMMCLGRCSVRIMINTDDLALDATNTESNNDTQCSATLREHQLV